MKENKKTYKFKYVKLSSSWQPYEENGDKHYGGFTLNWGCENVGFGQLTFYNKNGKCECWTECMSKEFIKAALDYFFNTIKFVDK